MDRLFRAKCKHATTVGGANAQTQVTVTGTAVTKGSGARLYLVGYMVSMSGGTPTAADFTITGLLDGTLTVTFPAAVYAPLAVMLPNALEVTDGTNIVGTMPALGASVKSVVTLLYKAA